MAQHVHTVPLPISAQFRIARALLLVCIGSAVGLLWAALWNSMGGARLALLSGLAFGSLAGWLVGHSAHAVGSRRLPGLLLSTSVLIVAVVLPELGLRIGGFRFESGVDFAPGPGAFARYVPDENVFWRWDPRYRLNSFGYPSDEPVVPKPTSMLRILYLGDSCSYAELESAQAGDSYPALTQVMLAPEITHSHRTLDTVNLAMPGYSSHQGRVLAERYGARLAPDVVVVYFGWNDHWPAFGAIDREKRIRPTSGRIARFFAGAREASRVVQAVAWLGARLRGGDQPIDALRVPLDQYEANLAWIGQHFEALGATTIFVTAPSAHYRLGVPRGLIEIGSFGPDGDTIIARHRAYNERVRTLTRARRWHLLDLDRELEAHPLTHTLFTDDGIHFTNSGKAYVAGLLTAYIADRVQIRPSD